MARPAAVTARELRAMLAGGDRRSIGRSNELAELLVRGHCRCRQVIDLLSDPDPLVRMRAADGLEKASAQDAQLITPFRRELVDLLFEAEQQELRWHLAVMTPRLGLKGSDRTRALAALQRYLEDRSSIVKTCAFEALAQLAARDARLEPEVRELLREAERSGTPAMRARARKLLRET